MFPNKSKIKRILVIKFGVVGDILLSTPLLPNLKREFPKAEIFFLTLREMRNVLFDSPYLTRTITYDPTEDKSYCLLKNIRNWNFDMVIDLYCNPRTAFITFTSGAKWRFGFNYRFRNYAYNITAEARKDSPHGIEFNLDALRSLNIPITDKKISLAVNHVHHEFAETFLKERTSKTIFGIAPSPYADTDKFNNLVDYLIENRDVAVLLLRSSENEQVCDKIRNTIESPECTIKYSAALISRCAILITDEASPMYESIAMNTPVVGILSEANPGITKTDTNTLNLLSDDNNNICMTEFDIRKISDCIDKLLSEAD